MKIYVKTQRGGTVGSGVQHCFLLHPSGTLGSLVGPEAGPGLVGEHQEVLLPGGEQNSGGRF